MPAPLWTLEELATATGGRIDGTARGDIQGISIDTRSIEPSDAFVALKDARDGHEFVTSAFKAGAGTAIVREAYERQRGDGALLRVADPLCALENAGRAARARLAPEARVIAVTGSVGKTGTKEMLKACLSRLGETHAATKSFNNHWGVPLSLGRMPAATRFGVFEIGMNHAGEITPLTKLVAPHVAIVTTVEAVHLEHFSSVEGIAEAKAEVFSGLVSGGAAVINRDNPHHDLLARRAREAGARVVSFGRRDDAEVHPSRLVLAPDHTEIEADVLGQRVAWRLAAPGAHIAQNALAVAAAVVLAGGELSRALPVLADMGAPQGRGARLVLKMPAGQALLIDESYNANPASMRSALAAMAMVPRDLFPRRIAVLGDMLELGPDAAALHEGLHAAVAEAEIDLIFASGPKMRHLFARLPVERRGAWAEQSRDLEATLLATVRGGDVVMVKGSFGSRMGPLAEALKARFGGETARA